MASEIAEPVLGVETIHEKASKARRRAYPAQAPLTLLLVDPADASACTVQSVCFELQLRFVRCVDGAEALFHVGREAPDVVVLPTEPTLLAASEVVTVIRRHSPAPIILAVREGDAAELIGAALCAGGSAVVDHPFRARDVAGVLTQQLPDDEHRLFGPAVLTVGGVELNGPAFEVRCAGQPVTMPLREFELLRFLMMHEGTVVTREQIRASVWGADGKTAGSNTIAQHVRRLRLRLCGAAELAAVRGVGYRLRAPIG